MYLKSLERLLSLCGYGVKTARSGQEALQSYQSDKADLIITDACMEGGSGPELIKHLRESGQDVRIVLHTGCSLQEQYGIHAGADGIIKKPSFVDQIRKIVEEFAVV